MSKVRHTEFNMLFKFLTKWNRKEEQNQKFHAQKKSNCLSIALTI